MAVNEPDITLTVGANISQSTELFKENLQTIVGNLDKDPLKVKVSVETQGIDDAKQKIAELTEQIAGVGSIEFNITGGDLGDITNSLQRLSTIDASLTKVVSALERITSALPQTGSALSAMAQTGSMSLDMLERDLRDVLALITELNSKEFNISNIFNVTAVNASKTTGLEEYRAQARELLDLVTQVTNSLAYMSTNSANAQGAFTALLGSPQDILSFYNGMSNVATELPKLSNSIETVTTSKSLQKYIAQLQMYYDTYSELNNKMISAGLQGGFTPDMSQYKTLTSGLESTGKQADVTAQAMEGVTRAINESNNAVSASQITEGVSTETQSIQDLCARASDLLTELRAKIEKTFDLSTVNMNAQSIYDVINEIKAQLENITINVTNANVAEAVSAPSTTVEASANTTTSSENVSSIKNELEAVAASAQKAAEALKSIVSAANDAAGSIQKATTAAKELPAAVDEAADATGDLVNETHNLENAEGVYQRLRTQSQNVTSDYKRIDQLSLEYDEIQELNTAYEKYISALDDMKNTKAVDRTQEQADAVRQYHDEVETLITTIREHKQAEDEAAAAAEAAAKTASTNSQEQINNYEAQIQQLQAYEKTLQSTYNAMFKSAGGASATGQTADELSTMRDKLVEADTAIQNMKDHLDTMTQDEINNVQQLQADIQNVVNMSQERQAAEQAATEQIINGIRSEYETIKTEYQALMKDLSDTSGMDINTEDIENLKAKYGELTSITEKYKKSKTGINEDEIKSTQDLINELENLISKTQEQVNVEKEKADAAAKAAKEEADAQKAAADEQNRAAKARDQSYSTVTKLENAIRQYSAAEKSSNQASREAYEALRTEADAVEKARNDYENGVITIEEYEAVLQKANSTLTQSKSIIVEAGDNVKSLSDRVGGLAEKFASWLSVSQIIMLVVRSMKQLVSQSIELDSAMTQLRIVTNETEETYQQFGDTIAETAQKIGASITDLVDATTTYARLGYDLEEASNLAEYTAMLQNVGDIEAEDAQNAITAIVKAFDVGVDDIEDVMDKLVVVGNNYPISVSQIAEGINNAASTMAAAGNSFEETVALLTAANTVVQDISKSSTGLRTITARIRNTSTELDELGSHKICPAA